MKIIPHTYTAPGRVDRRMWVPSLSPLYSFLFVLCSMTTWDNKVDDNTLIETLMCVALLYLIHAGRFLGQAFPIRTDKEI